jgi:hypothetical protein
VAAVVAIEPIIRTVLDGLGLPAGHSTGGPNPR